MKQLIQFVFIGLLSTSFFACSGSGSGSDLQGKWVLSSLKKDGAEAALTDCDKNTVWNFTSEDAEALGDGTAVKKLAATAPEDCANYGFDAKWTVKDGKLFVSTSRIGGVGGLSLAGLMEIKEQTADKLVVQHMKNELTLKKQ